MEFREDTINHPTEGVAGQDASSSKPLSFIITEWLYKVMRFLARTALIIAILAAIAWFGSVYSCYIADSLLMQELADTSAQGTSAYPIMVQSYARKVQESNTFETLGMEFHDDWHIASFEGRITDYFRYSTGLYDVKVGDTIEVLTRFYNEGEGSLKLRNFYSTAYGFTTLLVDRSVTAEYTPMESYYMMYFRSDSVIGNAAGNIALDSGQTGVFQGRPESITLGPRCETYLLERFKITNDGSLPDLRKGVAMIVTNCVISDADADAQNDLIERTSSAYNIVRSNTIGVSVRQYGKITLSEEFFRVLTGLVFTTTSLLHFLLYFIIKLYNEVHEKQNE